MPFYEYQCEECGEVHEAFQKMSDPPLEECERCGGKLRKVLHPVAVHFKGSGFYATDNRKNPYKSTDEGYDVLQRERERRAEQGDPISQRVLDSDSKSSSSQSDSKPKEKQKTS